MKNWRSIFGLAALTIGLASCGELFEVEEVPEQSVVADIAMERRTVDLMVGDRYALPATITPDSLIKKGVFWEVADTNIVSINDGIITAKEPGETTVRVTAVAGLKSDTCHVRVIPRWEISPYDFARDMVVYADVTINGKKPDEGTIVGAFCGDELRGVGQVRNSNGQQYVQIRIYSPILFGDDITQDDHPGSGGVDDIEVDEDNPTEEKTIEEISFKCYDHSLARLFTFAPKLNFDGETHGTLSKLFKLTAE